METKGVSTTRKQNIVKTKKWGIFNRIDLNDIPFKIIFQNMFQSDTNQKVT